MSRLLCLLVLLVAACGGGEPAPEYGHRENPASVETFSRDSTAYVLDWEGVWLPLDVNEPGYVGARRVKNLFLHSDDPTRWEHVVFTSDNSASIDGDGMLIRHATGQRGSPYFCNEEDGREPGTQAPALFASRAELQAVDGPSSDKWSPVGRTNGVAIGSESNNPSITADLASPKVLSQTAQQFELHNGWCQTYLSHTSVARSYRVSKIQFEDLSGAKRPISSEYVPSTDKPGIQWFTSAPSTTRGGKITDFFDAAGVIYGGGGGGLLTQSASASTFAQALVLQVEPEATNRALWSTLGFVGTAVLDGASTTHLGEPPAPMGGTSIWTDPRSERLVYGKTDIATTQDQITSLTTDLSVFRAGESIWLHIPTLGAVGPVEVAEATPRMIRVLSVLPATAKGQKIGIQRVPGVGDQIVVGMNGGTYHSTTVTGVTLPAVSGVTAANLQHQSVKIDIAEPMPWQGGATGANGNLPVYWARTLPVSIVRGTVASAKLVRDDSTVQAGLGYLLRHRLVLELKAGSDYAMFDLAGSDGPKGLTTASAYIKTVGGKPAQLNLKAHAGGPFSTPEWQRLTHTTTNVNGTGQVRLVLPAGASVRVAVPQVEQLGWASSPIVTGAVPATRAATVIDNGSN